MASGRLDGGFGRGRPASRPAKAPLSFACDAASLPLFPELFPRGPGRVELGASPTDNALRAAVATTGFLC